MASSRDSSNTPDWRDIASAMAAYEQQEACTLELTVVSAGSAEKPDMRLVLRSGLEVGEDGEVKPSVYASALCSKERFRTLESAILFLLYQLDFMSALREFDGIDIKA